MGADQTSSNIDVENSSVRKQTSDSQQGLSPIFQTATPVTNNGGVLQRVMRSSIMRTRSNQIVQASLTVNEPGDAYEREADSVADAVMNGGSDQVAIGHVASTPSISRIQANGIPEGGFEAPPEVEARIQRMEGGGQALSKRDQNFFAQRMGYDFSGVRIHTDTNAVQASRDIQAKAFTVGNNIAFSDGAYSPETSSGRHLLAHELTHVVQQGHAAPTKVQRSMANIQRDGDDDEPQEDTGRWEWTGASGQAMDLREDGMEIESYTQRFLGLFMPARAMLSYHAIADKSRTTSDATVDIAAAARFKRFTSAGRLIATGWAYHNAGMSESKRWELDAESGSITTGAANAATQEQPIDGPLAVAAGVTKRVENVNERKKKLVVSIETKAIVGGSVSEGVSVGGSAGVSAEAGAEGGGQSAGVGGEVGVNASTSWNISYNGGESVNIYRATYIFTAEKQGGDSGDGN